MPGPNGYQLLSSIKKLRPDLPVVLMTAYGTVAQAVAAMREGATDYIVKPFDAQALIEMARRQLALRVIPQEMVAIDPESKRLAALARKMAENDATVLITGESGTGKEVYSRFIRDHSTRSNAPYVAINCAAIPENMLEATLFGYEKGAFTGAAAAHAGKFEQAQGGTLLLDEISEMNLGLQAKILRVLQEREVERLGSTRTISLDVRLIATSNRDLPEEVRAGRFRADLYYRLNVMSLKISPLRERRGDILPLARLAVQACARAGQAALTLSGDAEQKLLRHDWPGNARELANIVQRAAWLASGGIIQASDLDTGVGTGAGSGAAGDSSGAPGASDSGAAGAGSGTGASGAAGAGRAAATADGTPHSQLANADDASAAPAPQEAGLDHDLKQRECELILTTLRATGGSRKLTAERLGISPRTLRHKLQHLKAAGVSVPRVHEQQFMAV
jgi:two-component system response regulator FlrC